MKTNANTLYIKYNINMIKRYKILIDTKHYSQYA